MLKGIAIGLFIFIGVVIGFLILIFTFSPEDAEKEEVAVEQTKQIEFDKEEYKGLEKELIDDKQGAIISVKQDGRKFDVALHDDWFALQVHEQERIAESIYKDIKRISIKSELIKTDGVIDVMLFDVNGQELASRKMFGNGWDIK